MTRQVSRNTSIVAVAAVAITCACAPAVRSTARGPVTTQQLAELWEEPRDIAARDLYWGPWGEKLAPNPAHVFKVVAEKEGGFSPGFTVVDEKGVEWSVKQGAEAQTEVVVSRILSGVGYHQPPVYHLEAWTQTGVPGKTEMTSGRFRPKGVLDEKGIWSWQENPFVGTDAYQGLIALLMLVNGTDLKNDNNTLYEVESPARAGSKASRWYVVRDVGAALGETGRVDPRRGDPFLFSRTPFILGVREGFVRFNYNGRHQELVQRITPANMRWMARLVGRLSNKQWQDAFRAAGYGPTATETFVTRIQEKLDEARSLN